MIKKSLLILACILSVLNLSAAEMQIKQSSPHEVYETMFSAIINKNAEAMWAILAPNLKAEFIKKYKNEKKAKEVYWENFYAKWNNTYTEYLYKILFDPDKKKNLLDAMVEKQGHKIVKVEKIFYLDPTKEKKATALNPDTKEKNAEFPTPEQ